MTLRGTCPACFRDMPVAERKHGFAEPAMHVGIGRHGWQEHGGRQVGVYNRAWHSGACFGVGWLPFEISPEGTHAYIEQVLYGYALAQETALCHLATRPVITVDGAASVYVDRKYVSAPYQVRLRPGDLKQNAGYVLLGDHEFRVIGVPSYETALTSAVDERRHALSAITHEARDCYKRIAAWKWSVVRDEDRVPTLHFQNEGARMPLCGSRSHGLYVTCDTANATCSRCLLVAWLRKHGKAATGAEIKKALGWDTKRFNAAYDSLGRAAWSGGGKRSLVERTWTTPTRYSAKKETP